MTWKCLTILTYTPMLTKSGALDTAMVQAVTSRRTPGSSWDMWTRGQPCQEKMHSQGNWHRATKGPAAFHTARTDRRLREDMSMSALGGVATRR